MAWVVVVLGMSWWRGSQLGARFAAHQAQALHDPAKANAAVYRDQLAELEREYQLGNLNDAELQTARDELAQRLLDDVGDTPEQPVIEPTPVVWHKPWWALGGLILVVPLTSLLMYSVLGQPAALDPLALKQGV